MPQDSRDLDLDIANNLETAPYMGEPQFGYLNVIGSPTDDLTDIDIYRLGHYEAGDSETFYVGGVLREMAVSLVSIDDDGHQTTLASYAAGSAQKVLELDFDVRQSADVYVVIEDHPENDLVRDGYLAEPYVLTRSASLAYAQGASSNAQGTLYVYDGESGPAGSFGGYDDTLAGGDDTVQALQLVGSREADILDGANQSDRLEGLDGDDVLRGYLGNDTLVGDKGADLIYGNQGRDLLEGDSQNDTIFGGQDRDVLYGNLGSDVLYGNFDVDFLYGGDNSDTLYGGRGDDWLFGGAGDDVLFGGAGFDVLRGGEGSDLFVINGESPLSAIFDFNGDEGDRLVIAGGIKTTEQDEGLVVQQLTTGSQVILFGVHSISAGDILDLSF